jgi:hypothetical protein
VTDWCTGQARGVGNGLKTAEICAEKPGIPLALCRSAGGLNIYGREP